MVRTSDPNRLARSIFTGLGRRYDLLAEVLSFGQNRRWRRAAVAEVVPVGGLGPTSRVLDVATGTAGLAVSMAQRGQPLVVGVDLTEEMLWRGAANVSRAGLRGRIQLVRARAEQLPFRDGAFDGLSFSYLLRYVADPQETLTELARVVRPEGPVASLEFHVPPSPFWRFWWELYTRLVLPAAGGLLGAGEWYRVGRFLGPSISDHYRRYPLEWTVAAWERAGLGGVGTRLMSLGGGLVMWGRRRG